MVLSLKNLRKLQQKKYRQEYGAYLIEGTKNVLETLEHTPTLVQQIILTHEYRENHPDLAFPNSIPQTHCTSRDFQQISELVNPEGIACVASMPKTSLADLQQEKIILILEDIRDPGNLGTIMRTAAWFGIRGMLLLDGADPFQPKVVRSSMGALNHLIIVSSHEHGRDLEFLKRQGFTLVATRPETSAQSTPKTIQAIPKIAVIFGNEARGTTPLVDNLAKQSLSIPKYGQGESLNVAVSCGIILSQLKQSL